jgi:predicted DNA-binding protein
MPAEKKLKDAVVLFASIEREYHDKLRSLSFQSHRSIADLTREAIESYINHLGHNECDKKCEAI